MPKIILIITLFLSINTIQAQEKYTISGHTRDASSGEELIGSNIIIKELDKGTSTNV